MRIAVLGGTGVTGRSALAACRRIPGATATCVARRGELSLDLLRSDAAAALDPFSIVVNSSDSTRIPPDPIARRVLARGGTFIETSADPAVVARLAGIDPRARGERPLGSVILCGGLFPGISQLLARAAVDSGTPPHRLEIAVRYNAASGAGRSTCRLMASALSRPQERLEVGALVREPPVRPGPRIEFPGGAAPTVRVGLAESLLFGLGRPGITTASHLAPAFPVPTALLSLAARATPWGLFSIRPLRGIARAALVALRRGALRGVETAVELVATADRGAPTERSRSLRFERGMAAVGTAAGATAAVLAQRPPPPGVHPVDAVSELEETLVRFRALGG